MKHIPRFYLNSELKKNSVVIISASQMHHAIKVLRLQTGDNIRIFNSAFGEWNCIISDIKKCAVTCNSLYKAPSDNVYNTIIAFSIIDSNRISILLEKITELGISEIIPIISQYTQYKKFSIEKAQNIVIRACEQSGRINIPKIHNPISLNVFLKNYSYNKKLVIADETLHTTENSLHIICNCNNIFLIGPEGGFSNAERELFAKYEFITRISLGNNILRSETAAIVCAAMAMLQTTGK